MTRALLGHGVSAADPAARAPPGMPRTSPPQTRETKPCSASSSPVPPA